jgi:hypothetical protein
MGGISVPEKACRSCVLARAFQNLAIDEGANGFRRRMDCRARGREQKRFRLSRAGLIRVGVAKLAGLRFQAAQAQIAILVAPSIHRQLGRADEQQQSRIAFTTISSNRPSVEIVPMQVLGHSNDGLRDPRSGRVLRPGRCAGVLKGIEGRTDDQHPASKRSKGGSYPVVRDPAPDLSVTFADHPDYRRLILK